MKTIRTLALGLLGLTLVATTTASAQMQPRPPQRPPWQDVCCGGPCCIKPHKPAR